MWDGHLARPQARPQARSLFYIYKFFNKISQQIRWLKNMVKKSLSDVLREEMKPHDSTESNLSSGEIAPVEKNEVSIDLETAIASANEKISLLTAELATEKKKIKPYKVN